MSSETQTKRDTNRGYRVSYLARKYGLRQDDARELIAQLGHHRDQLNAAAQRLARQRRPGD